MSAFETYVTTELPLRSSHLTVEITGYDGDPNNGAAPAALKLAPKGAWYMQETPEVLWWRKQVSGLAGATSWLAGGARLPAHADTHQDGGTDEIDVGTLGSLGAPGSAYVVQADGAGGLTWVSAFNPTSHVLTHQDGGADELNVGGLSGVLADPQTPAVHATTHQDGGADEINVAGLSGVLADPQTPAAHVLTHQDGGADELNVGGLSGVLADPQTPASHAATHQDGGADELDVSALGSTSAPAVGYFVQADGLGGLTWVSATTPLAHAATHQNGGADELNVAGLSGVLADPQTPAAHVLTHQDGGLDELNVAGLSGVLADPQTPAGHVSTHANGGADELNVAGLSGVLADPQTAAAHALTHQNGGADEISVAGLSGLLADPQTAAAHAASHQDGGADELDVSTLGSTSAPGSGYLVQADGLGGLTWVTAGTPGAHAATHQDGGSDELDVSTLGSTSAPGSGYVVQSDGLGGLAWVTGAAPAAHATTHQDGGADEINVGGLSGLLADPQTPLAHVTTHQNGGADELSVAGLSGLLADPQTPTTHATSHQSGGSDAVALDTLAAPTDNTNLDATTGAHGLLPKLAGTTTDFLRADGTWAAPGGSGWIYVTDATTQGSGTVTSRVWQDAPGNTVLQSFTASSPDLRLSVRSSYPLVDIGGVAATLPRDGTGGFYSGLVDITVAGDGDVIAKVFTADGNDGAIDTFNVTLDLPPQILTLSFTGGYPGSQTELKAGDTFQITGTTDKAINQVEIQNYEAFQFGAVVASGTAFTVSGTIADRGNTAVARPARVRVRDAVTNAYGPTRDTNALGGTVDGTDLVTCNNLFPTVSIGTITYPATQGALKASETATVGMTTANFTTIQFTSPNGDLAITNPTTDEPVKTVTRIAGSYNISVNNFRAIATRAENAAVTTSQTVVRIANVAAAITVAEPAARLRSGGNDGTTIQNHTITISSDQLLSALPSMSEDTGGGTFIGAWAGTVPGTTYTRTLQVHDNDTKGTYTWQSLSATNLSGLVTTVITGDATYVLGGFVQRDLTFAAFATSTPMNVEVVDFSKLTAGIFTATALPALKQPIGTSPPVVNGYTIDALSINPTALIWLDTVAAGANSGGTAQILDVEETV